MGIHAGDFFLNKFEAFEYGHLDCPTFFVSPRTYELTAYMFHGKTHRLWKVPRWIAESPFFHNKVNENSCAVPVPISE